LLFIPTLLGMLLLLASALVILHVISVLSLVKVVTHLGCNVFLVLKAALMLGFLFLILILLLINTFYSRLRDCLLHLGGEHTGLSCT